MFKKLFICFSPFVFLPFFSAHAAQDCEHSKLLEQEFDMSGFKRLQVNAGAGKLIIAGKESSALKISAEFCAQQEADLQQMAVDVVKGTEHYSVTTKIPSSSGWGDNDRKSIDLVLEVPHYLDLEVDDSSGSAEVSDVSALKINDSSGSLTISGIANEVDVRDSSGSIRVLNSGGDVRLRDSSGSIELVEIAGGVHVVADSSGSISAMNVAKDVIIDRDSSGSISVSHIGGDFVVRKDGSGGISFNDVAGKVTIPESKRNGWSD